jgi:sigma-E factor negative regulatory protein RseB
MHWRRLLAALIGAGTTLWAPLDVAAQSGKATQSMELPAARAWALRVHEAATQRNYNGTQVFSSGASVSSARVAHYSEGTQQFESVEMLDGQARRVLRHNDTVYTLWLRKQVAVVEQRPAVPPFPALPQGGGDLFESYELVPLGSDRQAGHDADVFVLKPRDGLRFAQRLWADSASGLLLRADLLGPRGELLESASFSEVSIDVRPQPEAVLAALRNLNGYRIKRLSAQPTQLEVEGWTLRPPVSGFRAVGCVKRPMRHGAGDAQGDAADVLHAVYSDGLTHVSLFVEPFDAARHTRPMQMMMGATHTLMSRRGDWWVTAVGDVPMETLKRFVAALERRKP